MWMCLGLALMELLLGVAALVASMVESAMQVRSAEQVQG